MPYIAPEVVQEAKRMDLLTYLKNYLFYIKSGICLPYLCFR